MAMSGLYNAANVRSPTMQSNLRNSSVEGGISHYDLIRRDNGKWTTGQISTHDLCAEQEIMPEILVVFLPSEAELISSGLDSNLSNRFHIPHSFWQSLAQDSNGYFSCKANRDEDRNLERLDSQFRFLIKKTAKQPMTHVDVSKNFDIIYLWQRLGFFTSWLSSQNLIVFCFDLPPLLKQMLVTSLQNSMKQIEVNDPFAFHAFLTENIVVLYDAALWSIRHIIRDLEQNRTPSEDPQPDYKAMHEIARHIIHTSEVLAVAIETMASITIEHEIFFQENPSLTEVARLQSRDVRRNFRLQSATFKGLHLRSKALEERLRNEINLAFNIVAQHDSRIAVQIAKAAQIDSTSMKTISVLGLLFLPGTFLCAVFSTSFFNFFPGSNTEPQRWTISDKFWIFWVVATLLTAATVTCWFVWQQISMDKYSAQRQKLQSRSMYNRSASMT